ncbi:MAG: hypothetical protein V4581_08745 [Bacteroidota bacterium]
MKNYFPTLLSKSGEFKALSHLSHNVKSNISPIIQVLNDSFDKTKKYLINSWSFKHNSILIDFSLSQNVNIEHKRNLLENLLSNDVNIIPVIDSNTPKDLIQHIKDLADNQAVKKIGIRFSNETGGLININSFINNSSETLGINKEDISIILDLGYVEAHNFNMLATLAIKTILSIESYESYENIIVASSSFLNNLSSLSPAGRLYRLPRYEWNIWLQIQNNIQSINIKYSDYGTKHPIFSQAPFAGTCSIKYSGENEYIIYRGELSANHPEGNGQYIIFADKLINTNDFPGKDYSWGDLQIFEYANENLKNPKRKTGNAESWVTISQNHHITLMENLLG